MSQWIGQRNEEASMRQLNGGWTAFVLALALVLPSVAATGTAQAAKKSAKSDDTAAASSTSTAGMSKEDQEKLREHNKLRAEIKKVKYPAAKADVVAHVKGIKADDKKWFEQTLPDKTFSSADDVYSALGWETTAQEGGAAPTGASTGGTATHSSTKPSTTK
jgi:hypothetical protein